MTNKVTAVLDDKEFPSIPRFVYNTKYGSVYIRIHPNTWYCVGHVHAPKLEHANQVGCLSSQKLHENPQYKPFLGIIRAE